MSSELRRSTRSATKHEAEHSSETMTQEHAAGGGGDSTQLPPPAGRHSSGGQSATAKVPASSSSTSKASQQGQKAGAPGMVVQEQPSKEFLELFHELDPNLSGELVEKAWKQYESVGQQIILEGGQTPWMACSFYVAVWQSTPIGQELIYKYSLSRLLSICNLSVLEFFEKLNKWTEMINASRRLLDHVNRVQASLAVSTVVYKKFLPIFRRVFTNQATPGKRHPAGSRGGTTATTQGPTASQQLFDFMWTLFVAMKKQLPAGGDDLMNSFHLMLCIVDTVVEELKAMPEWGNRFLQPDFLLLLKTVKDTEQNSSSVTALELLCDQFEGVVLDAKFFRAHWLTPRLRRMSDDGEVHGWEKPGGLLNDIPANQDTFDRIYEEGMLRRAEVDERLFISSQSAIHKMDVVFNEALDATAITLLRRVNLDASWAIDAELLLRMSTQSCLEKLNTQRAGVQTPLSARSYVITPEQFCPTGQPSANDQRVVKMEELVKDYAQLQLAQLEYWVGQPASQPAKSFIEQRLTTLEERFDQKVSEELVKLGADYDSNFSSGIQQRKHDTRALFHRLLLQLLESENQRTADQLQIKGSGESNMDLSELLLKPDFIDSIWVCALELQLFAHSSERAFPWSVVEVAQMAPVNFYKIIELLIRADSELTREMVKHLSKVEERVLEELAWLPDSPLWNALAAKGGNRGGSVPSYEQIFPSQQQQQQAIGGNSMHPHQQSGISASGRFAQSPLKMGGEKRRAVYHQDQNTMLDVVGSGEPKPKRLAVTVEGGGLSPSLAVFFRKLYQLAALRLNDLCDRVRMLDESNRNKVWTLFEYILREETQLMKGRHLDQQLMCCLYIVAKVGQLETSFHDIMYHYRHQPQAVSRVYRRVLLDPLSQSPPTTQPSSDDGASRDSIGSMSGGKLRSDSAVPVPEHTSAPPTPEPNGGQASSGTSEYVDLIKYYNRVFVGRVEEFVRRMSPTMGAASTHTGGADTKENIVNLISMPRIAMNPISPRRVVNNQINVLPLLPLPAGAGVPSSAMGQPRQMRYSLNRSPSRDLRNINAMVGRLSGVEPMATVMPISAHGY